MLACVCFYTHHIERMWRACVRKKKGRRKIYPEKRKKNREKKEKKKWKNETNEKPERFVRESEVKWTVNLILAAAGWFRRDPRQSKAAWFICSPFQLQRRPVRTHTYTYTHYTYTHFTHNRIYIRCVCTVCSLGLSPPPNPIHAAKESPWRAVRSNGSFCMSSSRPLLFIFHTPHCHHLFADRIS